VALKTDRNQTDTKRLKILILLLLLIIRERRERRERERRERREREKGISTWFNVSKAARTSADTQ